MIVIKTVSPPTEGIHHCEPNTTAVVDDKNLGKGTLYISERVKEHENYVRKQEFDKSSIAKHAWGVLCWLSNNGEGFSLSYLSISVHGVSKDESISPEPCLFLISDGKISCDGHTENGSSIEDHLNSLSMSGEEDESDEESGENSQVYFVPENKEMLDIMFKSLSDCQTMNPDPNEEEDDENDEIYMAPSFDIHVTDRPLEEYDDDEEEDEGMNDEDQFEDAEQ